MPSSRLVPVDRRLGAPRRALSPALSGARRAPRMIGPACLLAVLAGVLPAAAPAADLPVGNPHGFTSGLPLNPVVQALVDSVSAERLEETVVKLVGFFTRHTNSDTTTASIGIGAARNWVRDQFQVYSNAHGGIQEPRFFDFNATICAIAGFHRNALSVQTGTVYPDRFFLVSGHLDGRTVNGCDAASFAPSANDDGSGSALSIEMAYLIGKIEIESSMIFMTVTGEDEGLFGSEAYAEWVSSNGMDLAGMATNDVVGNIEDILGNQDSTRVRHFSGPPATSSSRQLARYFKLKGEAYQPGFEVDLIPALDRPGRGGDHIPFYDLGYPAVRFTEALENGDGSGQNGHQHNATDLPEFMNFPYCAKICRVNVAGFASLLLAPKPPAGAAAADVGNGTEVFVSWLPNSEADLAGYRVAFRFETGDSLFYQDIFDAGLMTSHTITGLTEGVPVLVSVSAYDTDFNESVFGPEQRVVPATLPSAPSGLESTSRADRVDLDWDANPEIDIDGYNIYRSTSPTGGFQLLGSVGAAVLHFEDTTAQAGILYHYQLRAVDDKQQEGPPAGPVKGRLADHALGILIVDATADGTGGLTPIDAAVDLFYAGILSDLDVAGEWDRADSVAVGNLISDADLGAHHTVVYHHDAQSVAARADTISLRKYLLEGGRLMISISRPSFSMGGVNEEINPWTPGEFMHDILKATETRFSQGFDFSGALGQQAGYPDLAVDTSKWPLGRLVAQEAHTGPLVGTPTTEVIYHYQSWNGGDLNHNLPDAIRVLSPEMRMVAFSFPLYFLDSLSVRQAVATAIDDLGQPSTAVDGAGPAASLRFGLGLSVPNPFNPRTRIDYVADRRERVALRIFDVQGRLVRTLVDGQVVPGTHRATWDGRSDGGAEVRSGVYFIALESAGSGRTVRRKLVLVR